jgi:hypothetical protein
MQSYTVFEIVKCGLKLIFSFIFRCCKSKRGDETAANVLHPVPNPRAREGVPFQQISHTKEEVRTEKLN